MPQVEMVGLPVQCICISVLNNYGYLWTCFAAGLARWLSSYRNKRTIRAPWKASLASLWTTGLVKYLVLRKKKMVKTLDDLWPLCVLIRARIHTGVQTYHKERRIPLYFSLTMKVKIDKLGRKYLWGCQFLLRHCSVSSQWWFVNVDHRPDIVELSGVCVRNTHF